MLYAGKTAHDRVRGSTLVLMIKRKVCWSEGRIRRSGIHYSVKSWRYVFLTLVAFLLLWAYVWAFEVHPLDEFGMDAD